MLLFAFLKLAAAPASASEIDTAIGTFLGNYCTDCHGEEKQKGKLSLHDIDPPGASADALEKWRLVAEQIEFLDMPPEDSAQPPSGERERILQLIEGELSVAQQPGKSDDPRLLLPEFGNYVDHRALFDSPAVEVVPASPSLWRLRPESYRGLVDQITAERVVLTKPFSNRDGSVIRDFAALAVIDEPAVELLLRNADLIVRDQGRDTRFGAIHEVLQASGAPDQDLMRAALRLEFRLALRREPSDVELEKFLHLWGKNLESSGHPIGSRATLAAVLMLPEVLFRYELGGGEADALGRRRLGQREIARALSLALRESADADLYEAAGQGKLATREQVAAEVQRLLSEPLPDNSRLLQFFREFFDYEKATAVFKDPPARGLHDAAALVGDLDALIGHIVAADRDVLRCLLTSDQAFVNWRPVSAGGTGAVPAVRGLGYATVYGLPPDWKWTREQPITLPSGERSGVLTHPAWLVAHSLNSENDPVRRGKWIRTRLLGGTVPDVPIGVDAKVPEDPQRTLRQRLASATSKAECWRCHQKMDPLGLPLEQFSHYGHFRFTELGRPVDASGRLDRSGVASLDGSDVADPFEMIARLANSAHVEQVFTRHAFRFFLGRNETAGDARTLQEAWLAYRDGGGSFKAMVASLLTSDSFLLRSP